MTNAHTPRKVASSGVLLQAAMQAPSQGYLAFGVSQSSKTGSLMDSGGRGSDMAIGYLGGDCSLEGCIFDYWSTEHDLPVKDATQNVTSLVHAHRDGGALTIEFDRYE